MDTNEETRAANITVPCKTCPTEGTCTSAGICPKEEVAKKRKAQDAEEMQRVKRILGGTSGFEQVFGELFANRWIPLPDQLARVLVQERVRLDTEYTKAKNLQATLVEEKRQLQERIVAVQETLGAIEEGLTRWTAIKNHVPVIITDLVDKALEAAETQSKEPTNE